MESKLWEILEETGVVTTRKELQIVDILQEAFKGAEKDG